MDGVSLPALGAPYRSTPATRRIFSTGCKDVFSIERTPMGKRKITATGQKAKAKNGRKSVRPTLEPFVTGDALRIHTFAEIGQQLDGLTSLSKGWNGYQAEPPSSAAIETAKSFLAVLTSADLAPHRVAPSVVGGVGFTLQTADRQVYVEFYNDGMILAMFSEGPQAPVVEHISTTRPSLKALALNAGKHLDAQEETAENL